MASLNRLPAALAVGVSALGLATATFAVDARADDSCWRTGQSMTIRGSISEAMINTADGRKIAAYILVSPPGHCVIEDRHDGTTPTEAQVSEVELVGRQGLPVGHPLEITGQVFPASDPKTYIRSTVVAVTDVRALTAEEAAAMPLAPATADPEETFQRQQLRNWTPDKQIEDERFNELAYNAYDCIQALQEAYLHLGNRDREFLISTPIGQCGGGVAQWMNTHPEGHSDPDGKRILRRISSQALTDYLAGL